MSEFNNLISMLNDKNDIILSQQAKIDEFKKLRSLDEMAINQLAQANQVWQIKCDELQGRINEALKSADINFWNSSTVKDMVDILKGNKDEN